MFINVIYHIYKHYTTAKRHVKKKGTRMVKRFGNKRLVAFTLAEVLITLAIIGVVATMTIPTLIGNYKKKVAETKLHSFYTTMNEAIRLSEIDNGRRSSWKFETAEELYNSYFANYIRASKVDVIDNVVNVYFLNGTFMKIYIVGDGASRGVAHVEFVTDAHVLDNTKVGVNHFVLMFLTRNAEEIKGDATRYCNSPYRGKSGITPYFFYDGAVWDTENNCRLTIWPEDDEIIDILMNHSTYGCAVSGIYCTELIRMNNWKIPEDYPHKF